MKHIRRTLTLVLTLAMLLTLAAPALAADYTVRKGDTLAKIALEYLGATAKWKAIYEANRDKIKNPNMIFVGQVLTLPGEEAAPAATGVYTVVAGDTLGRIAAKYNTTVAELAAANGIKNPNVIIAGQQLIIPGLAPAPAQVIARPEASDSYIPASAVVNNDDQLTAAILTPEFYENEGGPTIGVTLVGVVVEDGKYFRDLNNNGKLDDFEDWRLDAETRAVAMAKALSDYQLTHNVANSAMYSPNGTTVAAVTDENGDPVWDKLFSKGGGWGAPAFADSLENLRATGFRSFVLRSNPATEVAVWFNNGLEQYSEYEAMKNGEVAVPFTMFTNPIGHGLPSAEGVTAAALGDGNADIVLTDSQYDRIVMWAKGIDGIYGPQIDLATDPRWSRNDTTYGEREDMAAEIAHNLTVGYQNGDQGMVPGSVLLTVKHFPGDGAAYNGFESHGQTGRYRIYSTENSLADYQLKPFIAAFEAGAAGIMPGYSQPIIDERIAAQSITYNGKTYDIKYEGRGNAFNPDILLGLARDVLGFDGLINSDSLMVSSQQGVEDLTSYERMVLFIKAGCDCGVISFNDADPADLLDEALAKGDVTREDLERAAVNRLLPHIQTGNLDNPYRDMEESVAAVNEVAPKMAELAEEVNLKSVVLMKNHDNVLPLADSKKVYIQKFVGSMGGGQYAAFGYGGGDSTDTTAMANQLKALGYTVVDTAEEADIAFLIVSPKGPDQGSNVLGVIDLVEDVESPTYDDNAKPDGDTKDVTTLIDVKKIKKVADAVHANGGQVIATINISSPWILTNLEPYCDALMGVFSTTDAAVAQVIAGNYNPTGKLPMTMVADESVIALVETKLGTETWMVCVSPNDVPGYAKDQYMDPAVLAASPSGSYAYKDTDGNLYVSGFGLEFDNRLPASDNYIPAPYAAYDATALAKSIRTPEFYENENGPTIGVTLLGVVVEDGKYFRDLNNNGKLDDFEDWRLDDETRARVYAASLSDFQIAYELLNQMSYSPKARTAEAALDKNGNPTWNNLFTKSVEQHMEEGFRNFVVRSNPPTEVGVWFNNGLEQFAEWEAIQKGETAVPFLSFTNPIAHGMPGTEGVVAAVLGDGNADLVLTDAQMDGDVMWAKGIDGIYGPQIDLVTDPRWSRNSGTYGEREDMAAEIARNLTIGYQDGDQGMVPGSVLLTVKHFPGDGAAYNGFESHGYTGRYRVYTTENSLADYQLKPFIAAFEAGAAGVMPGYSQPIVDERIAPQSITYNGKTVDIRFDGYGNAFNPDILQTLLRDTLGFNGLINSDSISQSNAHGVENLSGLEQTVLFIKAGCNAGVFVASGKMGGMTIEPDLVAEALEKGLVTREELEDAAYHRVLPRIQSGDLDNPYRDMETSVATVNELTPKVAALAEETHLKSVVLMKNSNSALPMKDTGKKVYVAGFNQKDNQSMSGLINELKALGYTVVDDYETADIAYLRVNPTLVGQGSSTLAILDLGEDMESPTFDTNAKPTGEVVSVTTVSNMKKFQKIAEAVHANGGVVIGQIEVSNAWILTEMEPYCDALIGTAGTSDKAVATVITGGYNPTGKLPITMVSSAAAIALEETTFASGETWMVCVSPNDVPGYVKDEYISDAVKATLPNGSYVYWDADGNKYVSGFGLSY